MVRIGTFLPKSGRSPLVDLAGVFSSEPLVAAAWDGRPVFRLAESLVESEDGRQLTVTLRSDIRFHTGDPITAPVVRDLLAKKLSALPEIAGLVALDDRRLQFSLHKASSVKPEDLSTMLVDSNEPERIGLRTGPFKLVSTEPMVLERFDGYYQGKPSVERMEMHEYPTHRAAWTGMMRREVNFLHEVSRDAIDFVEAGGDIRAYPLLRPYYTALVFSMRHPVLKRREVRVAINEALDRNELVRNAMRGHGRIAEGPFWPYHWAYPQGRFPVAFNPEAAKLRLEASGLKVEYRQRATDAGAFRVHVSRPRRRRPVRAHCAAGATAAVCRRHRHADRAAQPQGTAAAPHLGRLRGVPSRGSRRPDAQLGVSLLALARAGPADCFR